MAAPSPIYNHALFHSTISPPFSHFLLIHGVYPPFHVCRRNQRSQGLGWGHPCPDQHDWFLEPHGCLVESTASDIFCPFRRSALMMIMALQLLIPWRFFRLWALAGGIDPPENMVRCMVNNYSTFGFWRSWHRSYNLWIIRYAIRLLIAVPTPILFYT